MRCMHLAGRLGGLFLRHSHSQHSKFPTAGLMALYVQPSSPAKEMCMQYHTSHAAQQDCTPAPLSHSDKMPFQTMPKMCMHGRARFGNITGSVIIVVEPDRHAVHEGAATLLHAAERSSSWLAAAHARARLIAVHLRT